MDGQKNTVGRRSVLHGAAWSVPVIAAVAVAPIAAASGAGTILFDQPNYSTSSRGQYTTISGKVTLASGTLPSVVTLVYPEGFTGPATATVDPVTGAFTVG